MVGVEEWVEVEIGEVAGEWVEVEGEVAEIEEVVEEWVEVVGWVEIVEWVEIEEVAEEEVVGEVAGVEIGEVEWVGAERQAGAEELTEAWADWSASRALLTRRAWIPWIP